MPALISKAQLFLALAGAALSTSFGEAAAAAGPAPGSTLRLEAVPLLGPGTPAVEGWTMVTVRLHNVGEAPVEGTLELLSQLAWAAERKSVTRAPFAVPAKSSVLVELPARGFYGAPPTLSVKALSNDESLLVDADVPDPHPHEPLIFDLTVPSRIAPSLRGLSVPVEISHYARGAYGTPLINVSSPQPDPKTGDPVLPEHAAGYASVTLVLAQSDALARIGSTALAALTSWVLAGGALAVVVTRPEDLRGPILKALAGGEIGASEPPASLKAPAAFFVAEEPSAALPTPSVPHAPPSAGSSITRRMAAPGESTANKLVGYTGGNLRPSRFGASASYGLGELHLLAFDATREPFVSDGWVKLEMLELVRHAWQRRSTIALPHAETALDLPQTSEVRRVLDPNEGTRWTIAVSALLLLLYSVFAGPVNFYLAAKKGRPLRALWHLPIWAAGALAAIVVLGVIGKGIEGRARRLSLFEAGAGMPRAAATRFRGFYASNADRLTVRASDRSSLLDLAGESDETTRFIVVDRDGARLERLRAKPWQTMVVREDGFGSLGAGVSVVDVGGDVEVKNRVARDLVGVVAKAPGKTAVYFRRIKDGQAVRLSAGAPLAPSIGRPSGFSMRRLEAQSFAKEVDEASQGAGAAWQALQALASGTDWWPDDVPVVLGELDGGEGKLSDSGLRVDVDRVLVRIVGFGGLR